MNRKDMDIVAGYIDASVALAVRKAVDADRLTRGAATEAASAFSSPWKDALDALAKEIRDKEPDSPTPCATCSGVGLLPERAMSDPQGQTACPDCPTGAAMAAQIAAAERCTESIVSRALAESEQRLTGGLTREMAAKFAAFEATLAAIPAPKDGASVTVDDLAPVIAAEVEKAVAALPAPQPGKDADPALVELMARRAVAELPKPEPGRDGVATRDELHTLIAEAVAKAVPDAVTKAVTDAVAALPRMEYREVWREGETYKSGNVVTFGGNAWVCMADGTPDKPGDGATDWRLMVRKGRDGKDKRE